MALFRYAIVNTVSGIVENVIEYAIAPANPPPGFAANYIAVQSDTASPGWIYGNGIISAPAVTAVTPAPEQQASAALAAGLAITSTGTPAVNGTYSCDDRQQEIIARAQTYIAKNNAFPGGLTSLELRLANGSYVALPSIAVFEAVATAIGDYVARVDHAELVALSGESWVAPASTATIA